MSYDIYLRRPKCVTCGHGEDGPECPDPTYNLSRIFDSALTGEPLPNPDVPEVARVLLGAKTDRPRGLELLNGQKASETIMHLDNAITRLTDEKLREHFVALEPENKWGTVPDALWVMKKLRKLADDYPESVWEVR